MGAQDPAVLHLRVVQGEGTVYAAGSRATRGVVVEVTNETGMPVEGAAVTFRLPDQGPTGEFASGKRSEILTTGPDGRAEVWGMQWTRDAGPFEMRITAAKGTARGGVVSGLYLSTALEAPSAPATKIGGGKKKLWITLALAAAATGAVIGMAGAPLPPAIAPGTVEDVRIGPPTVSIGRP